MGKINNPLPVKLVVGLIFNDNDARLAVLDRLTRVFGEADFQSGTMPFTYTDYYEKEFGKNLKRSFISFKELIPSEALPRIKADTNKLEIKFSFKGKRKINIDPGYLTLAKFVLASTKDYAHRVYLGSGIYAEMTLLFKKDSFQPWEWTYPDYRTREYIDIFNRIRTIYSQQVKTLSTKS